MAGTEDGPGRWALRGSAPSAVELWHRRMFVFSVTAALALVVEIGYSHVVPKIPQLYAALIRAAVWDCVLVGVLVAQLVDLTSTPLLVGTDGGHYLPLVVLLYHAMKLLFCAAYDGLSRSGVGRARSWHRTLVCRRVLLELAGGTTGKKLYLGRVCFVVSGGAMWLALRALLFLDDGTTVLTCFIILVLAAYCAAGLAALEPRHSLPGRLVQWLCTGWAAREAIVQGPLKIVGGLFLLPFAASVIAAQLWLRTVAFIVWLTVACPCCRLQRADNVYDAFERELAVPLLQCSFLAFASILAAIVLVSGELSSMQRTAVGLAAAYYTGMLMLWTAPTVLQAKVANEEAFDTSMALGDEGNATLLQGSRQRQEGESDIELEDLRSTCDELRALLQRERHDHSIEAGQLQERLRDQECQTRAAERERTQAKEASSRLNQEVESWRERCSELKRELALHQPRPELPRLRWPPTANSESPVEGQNGSVEVVCAGGRGRMARSLSEDASGYADSDESRSSSGSSGESAGPGGGRDEGGEAPPDNAAEVGVSLLDVAPAEEPVPAAGAEEAPPDSAEEADGSLLEVALADQPMPPAGAEQASAQTEVEASCSLSAPGVGEGEEGVCEDQREIDRNDFEAHTEEAPPEVAEIQDAAPPAAGASLGQELGAEEATEEAAADAASAPTSPQLLATPDGGVGTSAGFETPPENASDAHPSPRCGSTADVEGAAAADDTEPDSSAGLLS